MQRRNYLTFFLAGLLSWLIALGCSPGGPGNVSVTGPAVTVSAAASLQAALDAIAPQFAAAHPTIALDYNFASSGALQRQIEQGAPADVFFSAATKQMDALSDQDLLLPDSRQNLVANSLVLIAPVTSTLNIADITQLKAASVNKVAVGEFRSVPAGQYAEQVFRKLELLDVFQSKFVFGNNVRNVLAAVESGNVDLGIVYATDAALSDRIKILATVPAGLHQSIVYPIAIVKNTTQPDAAQTFIDFLTTDTAQAIFTEFGFASL
ncbi:molybdate-binding periplasmic protein [Leptolyngbya sp. Heron Island J]|uniref:molybdate ABC transporter substrate-binding protein n=1 Tax=Leptolyngbya sp. Heron Island J TaxID=1385935 RepID=UPI0003B949EE|nr:molybdate ABC transporter substrate-binding protein [Leptolyngbya sp. Heron Island J]ESA32418.1 molybdate-binding periplasmic protein [Leptolyngbya sp. Heron Island J]